jgi:hypothetical protein
MEYLLRLAAETADSAPSSDPLMLLLQYGVLGIFAVLMILYTRGSITRERDKGDRADAKVEELNNFIRQELLPKQAETALLHKQVADVLEEAIQLLTEMKIRDSISRQEPRDPPFGSSGGRRG